MVQLSLKRAEEDQANYVGGTFGLTGATAVRESKQKAALKLRKEQQQLDAEIDAIVKMQ
jgi:hypothetical protein